MSGFLNITGIRYSETRNHSFLPAQTIDHLLDCKYFCIISFLYVRLSFGESQIFLLIQGGRFVFLTVWFCMRVRTLQTSEVKIIVERIRRRFLKYVIVAFISLAIVIWYVQLYVSLRSQPCYSRISKK